MSSVNNRNVASISEQGKYFIIWIINSGCSHLVMTTVWVGLFPVSVPIPFDFDFLKAET